MELITAFVGRLHPLLVHLPIGILILAFLFECFSVKKDYKRLGKAVQPALLWGSVFAIAAAISGYFLRQEGGYDQRLADLHQNLGIGTAVLSLGVYVVRKRVKYWIPNSLRRKQVRILLFVPLIVLLSLTGHFGGSLTHGSDYLAAALSFTAQQPRDPAARIRTISNLADAVLYDDVIQPILEARCYDCHSAAKKKGDLRLDQVTFILQGGEDGQVISEGPPDSSALFKRLVLPIEDEDHMPPREKPQLSSSEIALIKYWLAEGAHFDRTIGEFQNSEKIAAIVESFQQGPPESWVPVESVAAADEDNLRRLRSLGITAVPLAEGSNYLMVSFTGSRRVTAEQIQSLQEIKEQLVWLNFGSSALADPEVAALSQLTKLRVLYLNHTRVSDTGLKKIGNLAELRLLSLVGTSVSDASLSTLEKFTKLNKLFLFQTALTPEAVAAFSRRHPDVELDTGNYELEKLPTDTLVYKQTSARE